MSIQQSNLKQPQYGYDTVVAISQKALNAAIENIYNNAKINGVSVFQPVSFYFVNNGGGIPVAIDRADLLKLTDNKDPLTTALTAAEVASSKFFFAFNFTIGNPSGESDITYLTFTPGENNVMYYLLCKQLTVVFWDTNTNKWVNIKQSTKAEFDIYAFINLTNTTSDANLPQSVLNGINAIKNLGGTDLTVQQLLFDLDSAVVTPDSTLTGLDSTNPVYKPLMQQFALAFFNTYTTQSGVALNYSITQSNSSTLLPTKMNWFLNAFVDGNGNPVAGPTEDQQDLATLNYLFSTNGDGLNDGKQLNWNWLDDNGSSHNPDMDPTADVNLYSGAIAINRDAFAKYLDSQLKDYVAQNWLLPIVVPIYTDYGQKDNDDAFDVSFQDITSVPDGFQPYNGAPYTPDKLVSWICNQSVSAVGKVNPANTMQVDFYFELSFSVYGQQATLSQTLEMYVYENYNGVLYGGAPVNKEFIDTFSLVIDDEGKLFFQKIPAQSYAPDYSQNITLPNEENGWLQSFLQAVAAKTFTEIPFNMPAQFVFPGGNAFTFKSGSFSNTSDLVCHISYLAESFT